MDLYDHICGVLQLLGVVFLRVLNISIAAGVMILAVALIRRLFPKMPKWLCCLLWALPALRLLPFSLPNPYSLAPNRETVYEVSTAVADRGGVSVPVLNSGFDVVDNAVNPALERTFIAATRSAEAVTAKARDLDPSAFFGLLWAAGCAVLLAYLLLSFLRAVRKGRLSDGRRVRAVHIGHAAAAHLSALRAVSGALSGHFSPRAGAPKAQGPLVEAAGLSAAGGPLVQPAGVAGVSVTVPGYRIRLRRKGDPRRGCGGEKSLLGGAADLRRAAEGNLRLPAGLWRSGRQGAD